MASSKLFDIDIANSKYDSKISTENDDFQNITGDYAEDLIINTQMILLQEVKLPFTNYVLKSTKNFIVKTLLKNITCSSSFSSTDGKLG